MSTTQPVEDFDISLSKFTSKLNEEYKFFVWLYYPSSSILSIDNAIMLGKKLGISHYLLFRKVIMWCKFQKMDLDKTIEFLENKQLMVKDIDYLLIIQEIFESDSKKFNIDNRIITNIIKYAGQFMKSTSNNVEHNNYPMINEIKGRPFLHWNKCYHYGCNYVTNHPDNLKEHLEQCNSFTPYFHKMHENIVAKMELDPEKIKQLNLIKCPSPICDKHSTVMTPDELSAHFRRLGIKPFWVPGDTFNYEDEHSKLFNLENQKPIYSSETCVICLKNQPSILFTDCNHHIICSQCDKDILKCPMCSTAIKTPIYY